MKKNTRYEILTPNGFKDFDGVDIKKKKGSVKFKFENDLELGCSLNHKIDTLNGYVYAKDLNEGDYVLNNEGKEILIISKFYDPNEVDLYDLINVDDERHRFIANDIIVSNCAFVPTNIWNDFWQSIYPTISAARSSKIILVSTPKGMNHYYKLWAEAIAHNNKFIPIEINWWDVPNYSKNKFTNFQYEYDNPDKIYKFKKYKGDEVIEMSIKDMFLQLDQRREQKLYQIEQNGVFKHFYGVMKHKKDNTPKLYYDIIYNDWRDETISNIGARKFAQEYETKFLASTDSLIASEVIENIVFKDYIKESDIKIYDDLISINGNLDQHLHIYKEPEEDHEYSIGVDPAQITEESSGDSVAIQITDITKLPFEQVGTIIVGEGVHYSELPKIVKTLGIWYNEAQVFIENNDTVGIDIADALLLDYEYDNIFCEKSGVPGFRTTSKKKKLGCLSLKMLIETGKLSITDLDTVSQLSTFIKKKNSYEAETGYNDDAVMALIHSLVFLQDRMGFEHKRQMVDGIKHETFSSIKEKEELEVRRRKEEMYDEEEHMPFGYSSGDLDRAETSVF